MNGNKPVPFRLKQSNGVHGKVALIVCDREEGVQSLVSGLAQKGMDIALACVDGPSENLIKDEVERRGRRFLAIRGRINSAAVIEQIIQAFGHLDLFIDCSTVNKEKSAPDQTTRGSRDAHIPTERVDLVASDVFANDVLTRAALRALTG
jgi:hypothetical protein